MLNRLRPVLRAIALGAVMILGLADASMAATERRVALVIGNGAYKRAPALENPTIDAKGMAAALRRIGFEVIDGYDLGFSEMRAKLSEFAAALPDSKAALVYYAGHGVSVEEDNYLLPVDIELKSVTDLDINAINVDLVLRQMKREERVNVVILDACRDNPFARELAASTKNRSAVSDRGLSRIDVSAKGTLIAFATDPKSTAADGPKGTNSPFTHALLKHIETPGISIDTVLNRVRADVWEATNKKQMPWVNTSLIGEFIMNPVAVSAQAPMTVAALSPDSSQAAGNAAASMVSDRSILEQRMWDFAEKSNLPEDYQAYVDSYPSGVYAQMARNRIARSKADTGGAKPATAVAKLDPTSKDDGSQRVLMGKPSITLTDLQADIGTQQTEKALALDANGRKDVQRRLFVLGYDKVKVSGTFDERTRKAIADWQKSRDLPPTTWLGKVQHAALIEQSEPAYQRFLSAQPMTPVAPRATPPSQEAAGIREAQKQRALAKPPAEPRQARTKPADAGQPAEGDGAGVGQFLGGVGVGLLLGGVRLGR